MTNGTPNFQNRTLYHSDNLDVLRGINSDTVHLIATDPPFNKSRDFHATPDSLAEGASFQDRWRWIDDVHDDWLILIMRDYPEVWSVITNAKEVYGSDMAAFLAFMGVRLIEMHRILRDDGSIYLHCDPTASHYLKSLMDAIFGKENFRTEIVWQRTRGAKLSQHVPKSWGRSSDIILYYVKSEIVRVNPYRLLTREERDQKFDKIDENGDRYFTKGLSIFRRPAHGPRPNLCYEWRGFRNPHPSGWTLSEERLEEEYQKATSSLKTGNWNEESTNGITLVFQQEMFGLIYPILPARIKNLLVILRRSRLRCMSASSERPAIRTTSCLTHSRAALQLRSLLNVWVESGWASIYGRERMNKY